MMQQFAFNLILSHVSLGFGLVIGFTAHLQNVTTNDYGSLTELHTPKISVTTEHIKSSQFSLAIAW
jgi:hypothetical protein